MLYFNDMEIFTIGYEGLTPDKFFQILVDHKIDTLLDVRERPISRKAGFSKSALFASCTSQEINYLHFQALGCPTTIRNEYRESGDWKRYTKQFLAYLETQEDEVERVANLTRGQRVCLVCFEADYNYCHRSFIAARVEEIAGNKIRHLNRNSLPSAVLVAA